MRLSLRVYFIDLIGFVRDGNNVIAVTPKALDQSGVPTHRPMLVFRSSEVLLGTSSDKGVRYGESRVLSKWNLDQEDLRVVNTHPGASDLILGPGIDAGEALPSGYSRRFNWVTPMGELSNSHAGNVAPTVKSGRSDLVTSRFLISVGTLQSRHFSAHPEDPPNDIHTYKFTRNGSDSPIRPRALVNMVEARVPLKDSQVRIEATKFDGSAGKRNVDLAGTNVEIVFANLGVDKSHGLDHFDYFYNLLDNWQDERFLPERVAAPTKKDSLVQIPEPDIVIAMGSGDSDPLVDPEACPQGRFP